MWEVAIDMISQVFLPLHKDLTLTRTFGLVRSAITVTDYNTIPVLAGEENGGEDLRTLFKMRLSKIRIHSV